MPRHIFVDKHTTYQRWRDAGYVDPNAFYYIEDSGYIYTHGKLFGGNPSAYVLVDDPRLTDPRKNPYKLIFTGLVDEEYDGSDEITINLPTELPASDVYEWAKAENKPSYTLEELGAAAADHTHEQYISEFLTDGQGNAITSIDKDANGNWTIHFAKTFVETSALEAYAPLASPAFTGTPTAPTVAIDNSQSIATNEAVLNYINDLHVIKVGDSATSAAKLTSPFTLNLTNQLSGQVSIDGSLNVDLSASLKYITITAIMDLANFIDTGFYTGRTQLLDGPIMASVGDLWELKVERLIISGVDWSVKQEITLGRDEYYRTGTFDSEYNTESHVRWQMWQKRINANDSIQGDATNVTGIISVVHGGTGFDSVQNSYMLIGTPNNEYKHILATSSNVASTIMMRDEAGNITVTKVIGNLEGNADTATNATNDANGNPIATTYAEKGQTFYLGETEIAINSTKNAITELKGVNITGTADKATHDAAGNVIATYYLPKETTFYIGKTAVSVTQANNTLNSLEVDIAGNAATATEATSAGKIKTPITINFLGAVSGKIENFDMSKNVEVTLALNHNHDNDYVKKSGDTMAGLLQSNSYFKLLTPGAAMGLVGTTSNTSWWRIIGNNESAHYSEWATAGQGTEPIYVSQYTGEFEARVRRITLLDSSGNTTFPGTVTASTKFIGNLQGNADTATSATNDSAGNNISETYAHKDQKFYIGNTEVPINRTAGSLVLDGVSISGSSGSTTGNAGSVTNGVYTVGNNTLNGNYKFTTSPEIPGLIIKITETETKGIYFVDSANTENTVYKGFIGLADTTSDYLQLGWSNDPTNSAHSLRVGENILSYKGYNIWHSGNSNLSTIDWAAKDFHAYGGATVDGQLVAGDAVVNGEEWDLLTLIQTKNNRTASGIVFASGDNRILTPIMAAGTDEDGNFVISANGAPESDKSNYLMQVSPAGVVKASTFQGALEGNASTATSAGKLSKKVKITVVGDATGEAETDFSSDVQINVQVTHSDVPTVTQEDESTVRIVVGESTFDVADANHVHDDRYHTKEEINTMLSWKEITDLYPD